MRSALLALLLAPLAGCLGGDDGGGLDAPATLRVSSPAFRDGGVIPMKYTCQGQDVSPPLAFGDLPGETRALALVMDDPDATPGTRTHWTFWNLPTTRLALPENTDVTALGAREGRTSFGDPGYGGPCPPSGTHRYFFRVYALDAPLDLEAGATRRQLEEAMEPHPLAMGVLMGTFAKS